jgi:hypothetical protein
VGDFINNGLGEPMCTEWKSMDDPVGPLLFAAGPAGWMEFDETEDGLRWRMWKPFDWAVA